MRRRYRTDVAVIGGGPAGSTVGALLRKYKADLSVSIFESESFPREHVGESQLPAVTPILAEMGVWDKVESANFPIKVGGVYRWGCTEDLWYLNFVPPEEFEVEKRPARLEGQRLKTAFQVERAVFDKILLDHAESLGCEVFQKTRISKVESVGGYVTKMVAQSESGEEYEVKAKYYVDASGERGVLREALGVRTQVPTSLKNIAFFDYWQNANWAETIGGHATRVYVTSLGWGWIWFIPISSTRTSIGLVLPVQYYKDSKLRPEDLYIRAIQEEPLIRELTKDAVRDGRFQTTKDWNFLADKLAGENWFLVGDSCGFADPILSAGMTLAHTSARKTAYSILELVKNRYPADWIREEYSSKHREQIRRHMRFAEFWYAGNGRFTDLKSYCTEISDSAGLDLSPEQAFAWLGTGGFAYDESGEARAASFSFAGVRRLVSHIVGEEANSRLSGCNVVRLNLAGARQVPFAHYCNGEIRRSVRLEREGASLPLLGMFLVLFKYLRTVGEATIDDTIRVGVSIAKQLSGSEIDYRYPHLLLEALEAIVMEGWVEARNDPLKPPSKIAAKGQDDKGRVQSASPAGVTGA